MKSNIISISILFTFLASSIVYGQEISSNEKAGDAAFSKLNIDKAIKNYRKEIEVNPNNYRVFEKLSNVLSFRNPADPESLNLLTEANKAGFLSNTGMLRYAQKMAAIGNYKEATAMYNKYFSEQQTDAERQPLEPDYLMKLATPNGSIKIRNVGELNTANSDFSPIFYKNKSLVYITTQKKRAGNAFKAIDPSHDLFTDIFVAQGNKTYNFQSGQPLLKKVDQSYMQGPAAFTKDYGVMYLTRTNYSGEKDKLNLASDKKTINLKIYRVNYQSSTNDWSDISEVKVNTSANEADYSYAHPAFSPDDEILFFASNMPGGYGGTDIWMARRVGSGWGTPENLGPKINTSGEEKFPFMSSDNTLYFASDGLPGLGGLDIFKTKFENELFSQPENLGSPINSKDDDFGFIIDTDGKEGFFSSNRAGGLGSDDIYHWKQSDITMTVKVVHAKTKNAIEGASITTDCAEISNATTAADGTYKTKVNPSKQCVLNVYKQGFKKSNTVIKNLNDSRIVNISLEEDIAPTTKLELLVKDCETNQPLADANVVIKQLSTGDEVGAYTKADGTLRVGGVNVEEQFEISVSKVNPDGTKYLTKSKTIQTSREDMGKSMPIDFCIPKGTEGARFKIENIYFDLNKWNIRPDAAAELEKVVKIMYENPSLAIELGSHTDCRGNDAFNQQLSDKRAQSTMEYIASRGIDRSRLTYKGYGESLPINNCRCTSPQECTDYEYQLNRRTEFKIIRF